MSDKLTRRQFLWLGAMAAIGKALGKLAPKPAPEPPVVKADVPQKPPIDRFALVDADDVIRPGYLDLMGTTVTDADEGLPWAGYPSCAWTWEPQVGACQYGILGLGTSTRIQTVDGGLTWTTLAEPTDEG